MRYYRIKASFLLLAVTTLACKTYGQNILATGARSFAMANSSILLEDEYAVFNNPGSLSTDALSFIAAYNTAYIDLGLTDVGAGVVLPFKSFTTGAAINYFGDELYNQLEVKAVATQEIGISQLGLRANYHQYHLQDYGYKSVFTIDMGGRFRVSEQVALGVHLVNLTRSKLSNESNQRLSSVMQVGISYKPLESFRLNMQVDKNIDLPTAVSFGLEYNLNKVVALRTGFNTSNNIGALGFGLAWQSLKFDVGGQYHADLGFSGSLSIIVSKR